MGFYERYILPKLLDRTCGSKPVRKQREKVVPLAKGRVLEIGFGSGRNLPFYAGDSVEHVWALDPSRTAWEQAEEAAKAASFPVEFVEAGAEDIPLAERSVDTVLLTFSLCTIPEPESALREARRVLKSDGRLIFCEHGAAPDRAVRRWQNALNPVWKRLSGGCNLNRDIPALIQQAGFEVMEMSTMYIPGPKFASFNYWGAAAVSG